MIRSSNEQIYYVYAYLDPRKLGTFIYDDFKFDHEPFYIGQGHRNRMYHHLKQAYENRDRNKLKGNKIRKIKTEIGVDAIIVKIKENLFYRDAIQLEIKLIKTIGRIDLNSGPLTNLTDGGDGQHNFSKQILKKMSENRKGKTAGINNPMYGKTHTKETRDKISKINSGRILSEEVKEKLRIASSGANNAMYHKTHSKETRKIISDKLTGKKYSKERCIQISERVKGENNSFYGRHHSIETIEKIRHTKSLKLFNKICKICNNNFESNACNAQTCKTSI